MNTKLLFTHALSPLHAGTGQGVGVIDLPIAREKATGLPFLPGSSVKGTLRDSCRDATNKEKVFGPETNNADDHAGAAQFADHHLLLLPIRSLAGTFAWVTSPYLLHRFVRDAAQANVTVTKPPDVNADNCLVVQSANGVKSELTVGTSTVVVLEDLDLKASPNKEASDWAALIASHVFAGDATWSKMLCERFCIVPDDVLNYLLNTATEITARIKLKDDTKTVQKGGLWYEEALPTETILYGLVLATPVGKTGLNHDEIFKVVKDSIAPMMQFGGKATVGRGLCRVQMQNGKQAPNATQPDAAQTTNPKPAAPATPSPQNAAPSATSSAVTDKPPTANQATIQPTQPTTQKPPFMPYTQSPQSTVSGIPTVRHLGVKKN